MTPTIEILVVDDEAEIRALLRAYLGAQGFRVLEADSAGAARAMLARHGVALALVDLGLPDEDGLSLTRSIRGTLDLPIIILTGRGDTVDKVVGLELGADDYITKPFDLRELLARIKTVLRRVDKPASSPVANPVDAPPVLRFAGLELRLGEHRLLDIAGAEVSLTHGEFKLLAALAQRPQRPMTRDEILDLTHGREAGPFDRTVDMQIARLRRKLAGASGDRSELIRSVRGVGYMLTCPVQRDG